MELDIRMVAFMNDNHDFNIKLIILSTRAKDYHLKALILRHVMMLH